MYDITLYGHLTVDTIFDGNSQKRTLGAMANMWRTFSQIKENSLKVALSPTAFGEALIYIDRENSSRTSNANLNMRMQDAKLRESRISHILYINELPELEFLSKLSGIVSADTCVGKDVDLGLLKYLDYLFISDDDASRIDQIIRQMKGITILHSPTGSIIFDRQNKVFEYQIPKQYMVNNVNVLGAGDMFASYFLYAILRQQDLQSAIEFAHIHTSQLIAFKNEKI